MIDRIRAFLEGKGLIGQPAANGRPDIDEKHLATVALMVEAAQMDEAFGDHERATIARLVRKRFKLNEEECELLIDEAERAARDSSQLFGFTRVVNDRFSHDERVGLIEMLWEVALADGVLHEYEDNLLRRIGGLIYVSDFERGEAKRRVMDRLGIA